MSIRVPIKKTTFAQISTVYDLIIGERKTLTPDEGAAINRAISVSVDDEQLYRLSKEECAKYNEIRKKCCEVNNWCYEPYVFKTLEQMIQERLHILVNQAETGVDCESDTEVERKIIAALRTKSQE